MKNEQILKKAIEKAVEGGYVHHIDQLSYDDFFIDCCGEIDSIDCGTCPVHINFIIFDINFAKAYWGEKIPVSEIGNKEIIGYDEPNPLAYWQLCLQQMVLEEEPLKYLEKFL